MEPVTTFSMRFSDVNLRKSDDRQNYGTNVKGKNWLKNAYNKL